MENIITKENKMGTMSTNKLLLVIASPIILSMMVQALYNIVDSLFVAQLGESALSAVSLAFPIQQLMIAVGVGTAVGVNALLSRSLGEKDYKKVNKLAMNGIFLAVISSLLFVIFGLFFSRMFFESQITSTAVDGVSIIENGTTYLSICTIFSAGIFGTITFERFLQGTGLTKYCMIGQLCGAITNIILDPIFIFGWFGVPAMGIAGAAIATVIAQFISLFINMYFNFAKNHEIKFQFKKFVPDFKVIKNIYKIAFPAILNSALMSLLAFAMNGILLMFSTSATAVMGVYIKVQSFIFMPVIGLYNGMVPIIAYNYGAKNSDRIRSTIKHAMKYSLAFTVTGLLAFQIFPNEILSIFLEDPASIAMGAVAFRTISATFCFGGLTLIMCAVFQAMGESKDSLIVQSFRQLLFLLPLAYYLSTFNNIDLIWLAFPISDLIAIVFCIFMYKRIMKNKILKIEKI